MSRSSLYLATLLLGCLLAGVDGVLIWWLEVEPSWVFESLWPFAFAALLALWVFEDSRHRSDIYRPHEYGFLVFFFWVPYIPYYLWKTRRAGGLVALVALAVLFNLGYLLQFVLYAAL